MKKVLVIVGPTAVGKTDLSLKLAKAFAGEIISGDSIQIYKGFDIGSGKVEDMQGVVHYAIDELDAKSVYSVYDFQQLARARIASISANGHLPMIVGGTGLYIKACLYDYEFTLDSQEAKDYTAYSNEQLLTMLQQVDPESAQKIHVNNRRRLERALTIAQSGNSKSSKEAMQQHEMIYDALIIGCTMERASLYERINQRVRLMQQQGLKAEVEKLLASGVSFEDQPMKGIGYRQWQPYFADECTEEDVIAEIQKASRNFAKRQYTWFNNQMKVHWVDMQDENAEAMIMKLVEEWLADGRV
ncbi:MAG: tRNA (adenosine(37)-N6)-dimethylallyltransferase MiaA [Erysipelotrichaceae bacterium]|nr:tRNA (adenosine(37)-N6)-dimethylallyltransferase MiaA [Erysipelotrichaceae bacterium]MDY5251773.1 tRNA (adenosine(37)-N6)-dimethylallyltransferase MiaA [Erysipelotrichaceae bacterium]